MTKKLIRNKKELIDLEQKMEEDTPITPRKNTIMYLRMPTVLFDRIVHQANRLSVSRNILAKMAFTKFVEEEEASERKLTR